MRLNEHAPHRCQYPASDTKPMARSGGYVSVPACIPCIAVETVALRLQPMLLQLGQSSASIAAKEARRRSGKQHCRADCQTKLSSPIPLYCGEDQVAPLFSDRQPEKESTCIVYCCRKSPPAAGEYDPCVDNEVEIYFNREDVQTAMHANTTGMPGPWVDCNSNIAYSM